MADADKHQYRVVTDAWIYGLFREKDDVIELNEKQAKYLVLEKTIELAAAVK